MLLGKRTLSTPSSFPPTSTVHPFLSPGGPSSSQLFQPPFLLPPSPRRPPPEMLSISDQGRRVGSRRWPGQLPSIGDRAAICRAEGPLQPPPRVRPLPGPVLWTGPFVYAAPARPLKLPIMFQRNELVSHHESGFEMREKSPGEAILGNWGHSHLQSGGSEPRNAGKFIPRQEPRRD